MGGADMNRDTMLQQLHSDTLWDIVIIGGGATGLGCAVDATSRGLRTVLIEQADFSKGTSSRSTKLVHGGVRYLQQGDVSLVLEALHERGLLLRNAPHLIHNCSFIIPNYSWWEGPFYTIGLKVYDMMAGKLGLGPSLHLSADEVLKKIPGLRTKSLHGGVIYHDGQFDDARLAINLAQSCCDLGGTVINYMKCTALIKDSRGIVAGVVAIDLEKGTEYRIQAKVVINATGVWADDIKAMDCPGSKRTIVPSQGIHIVLDKEFLQSDNAIMIPHTLDGRVLFAVPWHNKVLVGTTDTPVGQASPEPKPLRKELRFILNTAGRYLSKVPHKQNIRSMFAGLRPLVAATEKKKTKELSRNHKVEVSVNGLLTISGGKWTTYRKMAEDTINKALLLGGFSFVPCNTNSLPIHGFSFETGNGSHLDIYGSDKEFIVKIQHSDPDLATPLSSLLPYTGAEVVWAVSNEMARTVEDVLARRTRALFLNASASITMAPAVAAIMKKMLNKNHSWEQEQIQNFILLAKNYLP